MTEQQSLWLCEYCDHAPYHSEGALTRHNVQRHTADDIALFGRDMTYRALVRKASRVAKVVVVVSGHTYDDCYKACYDATIDLLLSEQPITYRNIRRDAYRMLFYEHETSLDEMRLDGDEGTGDDSDTFATSHAYAIPDAQYALQETLLEVATGKFAIETPTLWLGMADETPNLQLLSGYDAIMANTEQALDDYQLANRKATERRGRPRKQAVL